MTNHGQHYTKWEKRRAFYIASATRPTATLSVLLYLTLKVFKKIKRENYKAWKEAVPVPLIADTMSVYLKTTQIPSEKFTSVKLQGTKSSGKLVPLYAPVSSSWVCLLTRRYFPSRVRFRMHLTRENKRMTLCGLHYSDMMYAFESQIAVV